MYREIYKWLEKHNALRDDLVEKGNALPQFFNAFTTQFSLFSKGRYKNNNLIVKIVIKFFVFWSLMHLSGTIHFG